MFEAISSHERRNALKVKEPCFAVRGCGFALKDDGIEVEAPMDAWDGLLL